MTLWTSFALLTVGVLLALLLPLVRRSSAGLERADSDLVVYKDQLSELEVEVAHGWLDPGLAGAARTEIERRMLSHRAAPAGMRAADSARRRWPLPALLVLGTAAGAFAVYGMLGAPALKGQPYAARQSDPTFVMAKMVNALAVKLRGAPDAAGYATLAESLFTLKRYDESIEAFRQAIGLGMVDPEMLASLGEAYVMTNDGAVVPEAQQAFQHALMLDRKAPRSRFYLGLARAQIGEFKEAVSIWRDLANDTPPDAPWRPMLEEHIRQFADQGGFAADSVPPLPPGIPATGTDANPHLAEGRPLPPAQPPTPDPATGGATDDDGLARLTEAQTKTVHTMVDGLARRLETTPDDFDGWLRLARSYKVLGEFDPALNAARRAIALKPDAVNAKLALAEIELARAKDHRLPADFIATMQEVLALDPNNDRALYYLGATAVQNGHPDEARTLWNRLLDRLPAEAPERVKLSGQIAALPKT